MKKFLIFAMFLFVTAIPLFFVGCETQKKPPSTDTKIQLDLSNAHWNYEDNFETEFQQTEYEVKVVGLPEEIEFYYDGYTSERKPNDYTATIYLVYDEEKYELINDNLPRTLNWKIYDTLYLEKESTTITSPSSRWYNRYSRNLIDYIHFVDTIPEEIKNSTIYNPYYLWHEDDENGDTHLYFGLDTSKYKNFKLPEDSSYMFSCMYHLKGITGLDLVDFSKAKNLSNLFRSFGILADADKVEITMPNNLNLQSAENMSGMFSAAGNSNTLVVNLGNNFDTSNVTNMSGMFAGCGETSKNFYIDLGNKFHTSNVTNMEQMFANCGYSSDNFYLDLGNYFDVSKVAAMKQMFFQCGNNSLNNQNWHLEFLGNLSSSCDTDWMFNYIKSGLNFYVHTQTTLNILNNLGLSSPKFVLI